MQTPRIAALAVSISLLGGSAAARGQNLASFEKRTTVKTLANGLTVIICERPEAPVFSFFTHVDAGGAQEVPGITGLAHMFEHMAFKGTDRIGTTDYEAEKKALLEGRRHLPGLRRGAPAGRSAATRRRSPRRRRPGKTPRRPADKYIVKNEFDEIIDREGGVGVNAFTNSDETGYHYSMPSNRLELWAYLESERFARPVFREFYKERDVVTEERRMRTDSNPIGRLVEQFLAAAYQAHPYHQPVVGYASDLKSFSATDAAAFFARYYVPSDMVVAVVGDVKASEALPIIEKYFGRIPKGTKPEPLRTVEPAQIAEKEVVLYDPSQPFYIEGYHKPGATDPDDAVYEVIGDLMTSGRTSRLYRALVRDKKVAVASAGFNGFPGRKYPNLFVFFGIPTPEKTNADVRDAIRAEIERIKTEDVTDADLAMVKTRAKAELIRQLNDNAGLAQELGSARPATAIGASCSDRSTASTRSRRPTSGESPTRPSWRRTGPSAASRRRPPRRPSRRKRHEPETEH